MRLLVILLVVVAVGCEGGKSPSADASVDAGVFPDSGPEGPCEFEGRTYAGDEVWGWECNSCMCMGGTAFCTLIGCTGPNGDESDSCAPSGTCADGPTCGSQCCGPGQHCDGWRCVCSEARLLCGATEQCGSIGGDSCGTGCVDF
jgi:hypothetical protein